MTTAIRRLRIAVVAPMLSLIGGCQAVVLHPAGDVAAQQRDLLVVSTLLMLLIIVPVMALTGLFAWRYRASNQAATYKPDWDHSTMLELIIWSAPLMIIICLGALTWLGTHTLDPYRMIDRVRPGQAVDRRAAPLDVEVVALDWKWLFIYPQYGIATVNELAAPVDRPIRFKLTSQSVMNSFYVPAMAGMIYTMPGMQTGLSAVVNRPGTFDGFSANYSGAGFSDMRFKMHALAPAAFDRWVGQVRGGAGKLDRATYLTLARPTHAVPVLRFAAVEPGLFDRAVNMCVAPNTPCMRDQMMHDMHARGTMRMTMAQPRTPMIDARPLTGAGMTPPRDATTPQTASAAAPFKGL